MHVRLNTPIIDLHHYGIARLSAATSRKLAVSLAPFAGKSIVDEVTVKDLLNYFPTRYEDRSHFITVDQLKDGMEAAVELTVRNAGGMRVGRNRDPRKPPLYIFEITASDADRVLRPVIVKWFISGKKAKQILDWYKGRFKRGTRFVAYGRWEKDKRGTLTLLVAKPEELEILPPNVEALFAVNTQAGSANDLNDELDDPVFATIHTGRVPIYRKLGPFQTKRLREIMHSVLNALDRESIVDDLPKDLRERQNLVTWGQAIMEIHFPPDDVSMAEYEIFRSRAHRRLLFDELFWLSFFLLLLRDKRKHEPKGTVIEVTEKTKMRLKNMLPFTLTGAQKRVIGEIFADLKGDTPMNRLLQGDVGSGKTIVAFLAMFAVMENGYQTALMAPTEILAEQHMRNALRTFEGSDYRIELLIGSMRAAQKRKLQEDLAAGKIDMIIGTHAIIQDNVKFNRLGLVVIDEQHRFGVLQRAHIRALGLNPDVLVMTATPIPRSLAMTVYGDLEVSTIDELPPGRTPIKTVVCGEDQRRGVYRGIEREIKLGRQAYIVYPIIEESAKVDLKAATKMYDDLRTRIFPQFRVGLLHGKMKATEKESIMSDFVAGKIDILVSTTVIEVGVDVPNASLMIIEHAERFGLSQLHQLRGRVGRGSDQSYCVLLSGDKKTAVARERLGIMEQSSDGFKIAEKDLELRGQGEIFGTRQSGIHTSGLANIVRDLDILLAARNEATEYLTHKRLSRETSDLIQRSRSYKSFRLGSVG